MSIPSYQLHDELKISSDIRIHRVKNETFLPLILIHDLIYNRAHYDFVRRSICPRPSNSEYII